MEDKRRRAEQERQEFDRTDAITTYKENLEAEVAVSWDALVQMIARGELPFRSRNDSICGAVYSKNVI